MQYKTLQKIIPLLFAAMLTATMPAQAAVGDVFTIGGVKYKVLTESGLTGTVEVPTGASNPYPYTGALTIPANVTNGGITYTVVSIGNSAFFGVTSITSLSLPGTLQTINTYAFQNCTGISGTLVIPPSVTSIGNNAFYGCSGISGTLNLPEGLITIVSGAFDLCTNINAVVIPASVTTIGNQAFSGCTGLTTLTLPAAAATSLTIGIGAFNMCLNLTGALTIPEGTTDIGVDAFRNCHNITGTLTIPPSVTAIGYGAFLGCENITALSLPSSGSLTIGAEAFSDCRHITGTVTIPPSVTAIGNNAFQDCSGITQFKFTGATAPTLGAAMGVNLPAFVSNPSSGGYQLSSFTSKFSSVYDASSAPTVISVTPSGTGVAISGSIVITFDKAMNTAADEGTVQLNSLPALSGGAWSSGNTVFTISYSGLANGTLHTVNISGFRDAIDNMMTPNSSNSFTTVVTGAVGDEFTVGGVNYKVLTISGITGTVTVTGPNTYTGALTIPATVANGGITYDVVAIQISAINGCTGITALTLPASGSLTVGQDAFRGCTGITGTLTIPSSVTTLGQSAFRGCTGITALSLPSSGTLTIGESAFRECAGQLKTPTTAPTTMPPPPQYRLPNPTTTRSIPTRRTILPITACFTTTPPLFLPTPHCVSVPTAGISRLWKSGYC